MGTIANKRKLKRLDESYPKLKLKQPVFIRNNKAVVQPNINGVRWGLYAFLDGYWEMMSSGDSDYSYFEVPLTDFPAGWTMRFYIVPKASQGSKSSIYSNTFITV